MGDFRNTINFIRQNENLFCKDTSLVGIEYETCVLDTSYSLAPTIVQEFLKEAPTGYCSEQHADILEITTKPYTFNHFSSIKEELEEKVDFFRKNVDEDIYFCSLGATPIKNTKDIVITSSGRYKDVIGILDNHTEYEGITCGIHVNMSATSYEEIVDNFNYSIMIEPYISALTASSRFMFCEDTKINEPRLELIEETLHKENRVGLPRYIETLDDYLYSRASLAPFSFANETLDAVLSTDWHDVRIRVNEDEKTIRTEYRALANQPFLDESYAAIGFYLGLLHFYKTHSYELLPFRTVEKNKTKAIKEGLSGQMINEEGQKENTIDIIERQLVYANIGLNALNIDSSFLVPLEKRAIRQKNPSDDFADAVYTAFAHNNWDDALHIALKEFTF